MAIVAAVGSWVIPAAGALVAGPSSSSLLAAPLVSAGNGHTCGLHTNGIGVCWGLDNVGQSDVPNQATATWTSISTGGDHTCGLHPDQTAECWGFNGEGQDAVPNQATAKWIAIAAGGRHSCGIHPGGIAECWGRTAEGQTAVPNQATATWTSLSAGADHTCGIHPGGSAECWGYNDVGQSTVPNQGTTKWSSISAGGYHTCGIRIDATAQCWGKSAQGQITVPNQATATWASISAGGFFTCGLHLNGIAQCWGLDTSGQTDVPNQSSAVWSSISAGDSHTCGLRSSGVALCWGDNGSGETGAVAAPTIPAVLAVGDSVAGTFTSNLTGATFSVSGGSIPGLSVDQAGTLTGSVTTAGSFTMTVAATDGTFPGGSAAISVQVFPTEREFTPIVPQRLMDTRSDPAYHIGTQHQFGPDETQTLAVAGSTTPVPSDASAVVINITAVDPTAASHVDVWPTGAAQPNVSNVNFTPGQTVPNLAKIKVGSSGQISIFNRNGSVDVIVDVVGYYRTDPAAARFNPLVPTRIADTRSDPAYHIGSQYRLGDRLDPRSLQVTGVGGVPAGAAAVVANVTAVSPDASSHLDLWPDGTNRPNVSNLNYVPGQTVPNLVVVKLSPDGKLDLVNQNGSVDVIVDVVGYFSVDPSAAGFVATIPNRLIDTRADPSYHVGQETRFGDRTDTRSVIVTGGQVPPDAKAIVANVTVVDPDSSSHLDVWPAGTVKPNVSNLNYVPGQTVANLVTVQIGADGAIDLQNQNGSTDVIIDIVGYYR